MEPHAADSQDVERGGDEAVSAQVTAPGEGERRALIGYSGQLKVAATRILAAFDEGILEAIAVADPDAGKVDDVQLVTRTPEGLRVDGFQVKWSGQSEALADAEFRGYLADALHGRGLLAQAWSRRDAQVKRFVVHLHTNRPISTATLRGEACKGASLTLPRFLTEVWRPAQHGAIRDIDEVPTSWRAYVLLIAGESGLTAPELLSAAADVQVEFDQRLPEEAVLSNLQNAQFLRDVRAFVLGLLDAVTDKRHLVVLDAVEFLQIVGEEWAERFRPRSSHAFPVPADYQPIETTNLALEQALSELGHGYLVVTGSPGSGKSTLLTRELSRSGRLAARYYAYIPGDDTVTRSEGQAMIHDLLLALDKREGTRKLLPPRDQLPELRERLKHRLADLGREARATGSIAVILIDGLDHVTRAPLPQRPLLDELPPPEQIPPGILIVLGTRSVEDLPAHLQGDAQLPGRHIAMAPLDRRGTLLLADAAGLDTEVAERVWGLSEGHPLLACTFIELAKTTTDRELDALKNVPQVHGQVSLYYDSVWAELEGDHELIATLGLVCRLRGPIDLGWLQDGGTPAAAIELLGRLDHLFRTSGSGQRWLFFHDSFREYLVGRTGVRLGTFDYAKDRDLHRELARRCAESAPDQPETWEEFHHLLRAGEFTRVTQLATPAYFRRQLESLRPTEDVSADIREAATALAADHDPISAVRLCLAAAECNIRRYHEGDAARLARLLLELGRVDLAVAHVRRIRDNVHGNDRSAAALELSLELLERGFREDARRLFTEFEPLGYLGARTGDTRRTGGSKGPWAALYAWASAALLLNGVGYVIEHAATVTLDRDDLPLADDVSDSIAQVQANTLLSAIWTALEYGMQSEADTLISALGADDHGRAAAASARIEQAWQAFRAEDPDAARTRIMRVLTHEGGVLGERASVRAAELLARLGEVGQAGAVLEGLPALCIPSPSGDEGEQSWRLLMRRLVLHASLDGALDPLGTFPDTGKDFERSRLIVARHMVELANLWARARSGQQVGAAEITSATKRLVGIWDGPGTHKPMEYWSAKTARRVFIEASVKVAGETGPHARNALWEWWVSRWRTTEHGRDGGLDLVAAFRRAGVGAVSLRERLAEYRSALGQDAEPDDWTRLGLAWVDLDAPQDANTALASAVAATFGVGFRKDYQLSTWINLLGPLVHDSSGAVLAHWLLERVLELSRYVESGAAHHAALTLLRLVGATRPEDVLGLALSLQAEHVIDVDDVVGMVLEVTASQPSAAWWITLAEIYVALGAGPPAFDVAARSTPSDDLAERLAELADRVSVEGRPNERRAWREALLGIARSNGIPGPQIGDRDLEIGDETPPREDERHRTTEPETEETIQQLLERVVSEPDRGALGEAARRLREVPPDQYERLLAVASTSRDGASLYAAFSQLAEEKADRDGAWEWAKKTIMASNGLDWRTDWSGGAAIQAIRTLWSIDAERARPIVFERLASLASEDDYLLSTLADGLDDTLDIFGDADELAIAREILDYVVGLTRVPAPNLATGDGMASEALDSDDSQIITDRACGLLLAWLLGATHTLAWQSAQRGAIGALASESATRVLEELLGDERLPPERMLAVIDALFNDVELDREQTIPWLSGLATAVRLDVREMAAALLDRLGEVPPVPEKRALPGGLRVEIARAPEVMQGAESIDSGDIDEMLSHMSTELATLARKAEINPDALLERVRARALQLAAPFFGDEAPVKPEGILGWGYLRPSATAVAGALAESAAALVDAERIDAPDALALLWTWPISDRALLRRRPERRPACVPSAAPLESREVRYSDWCKTPGDAASRIATEHAGWIVIGEVTEVALLSRRNPREIREQGLVVPGTSGIFMPTSDTLEAMQHADSKPGASLILRKRPAQLSSPDEFIALHPDAAARAGLTPDASDQGGWRLDGELVVRSLWWQSGFARWPPHSDREEVGEGWLVLAHPDGLDALMTAHPGCAIIWRMSRALRSDETAPEEEVEANGVRDPATVADTDL